MVIAAFAYAGGYFLAGQSVLPYYPSFWPAVASVVLLLMFSFIFVWFADEISSDVGHSTYMDRESFLVRGLKVFIVWLVVDAVMFASFIFLPDWFASLLSFVLSVLAVYASAAIAVDGASIPAAVVMSWSTIVRQPLLVLEFLLLSFFLLLLVFVLDTYSGFLGLFVSVLLVTYLILPWLSAHAVLTYLYKYPMVVSSLFKFERS